MLFSVVIPTRNRAHLLQHALASVLDQPDVDHEIVVSDNSSHDDTPRVVDEIGGSRVRYVRTRRPLSMPDHWNFALDHARGTYVGFVSDDDAWAPTLLQRVAEVVTAGAPALVAIGRAVYHGANWYDVRYRNSLLLPSDGAPESRNSRETLSGLFHCSAAPEVPRMLNSFCHRDVIAKARQKCPRIFRIAPDYHFAAIALGSVPEWTYVPTPLLVQGAFAESIGASGMVKRGEASQQFVRDFAAERLLERVPLKNFLLTNYVTESLLLAKECLGGPLDDHDVQWPSYFLACWYDIVILDRNGVDVREDERAFFTVLSQQGPEVQAVVRPNLARLGATRTAVRHLVNRSAWLQQAEAAVRRPRLRSRHEEAQRLVSGKSHGFENILQCARKVPELLDGLTPEGANAR